MRASTLLALGIGLFTTAWQARLVQADVSTAETTVVARIGQRTVTAADLERRIAQLPPFQLRSFGKSPEEVRKNFLEKVIVRETLFAQGAVDAKLADRDDVAERLRGVLRNALLSRIRTEGGAGAPVTDAEVKRYYEENAAKFHSPARVAIWRIQVAKREEALAVIAELKKDGSAKHWTELARERSLDHATNMRGGNLGFVSPDGTTAEAAVKVEPAILAAVERVKDAELVPEPVKDADRWSVVWRRQSMKPVDRELALEAPSIRQIIAHDRAEKRARELVERLRQDHLADFGPELVDMLEVSGSGELQPARRPGTMQVRRPAAPPAPAPGPGGLR